MISAETFAARSTLWHGVAPSLDQYVRWMNQNVSGLGRGVLQASESRPDVTAVLGAIWASRPDLTRDDLAALTLKKPSGNVRPSEFLEAGLIAQNILRYPSIVDGSLLSWEHRLAGCGEIEACHVDLLIDSVHLVEIKAVSRAFRGLDLRQLLTYAAVSESLSRPVERVGLINPRRGTFLTWDVSQLALDLGSPSYVELMASLQMQMSASLVSD
jgi:hypothetical protein